MLSKSNFIDIFDNNRSVIIPIIQRDYAQGREDEKATRVREKFLQALYNAVNEAPITLDFIYGNIDETTNVITLLDGQQRVTTLFLLYWYAAKKASRNEEEYEFLNRFSYETRYSSRIFCTNLVAYTPDFENERLSLDIEDQPWFALGWKNDPTIRAMLTMLDAIDEKFQNVPDLWDKLKTDAITFYFLPIENMGLTDELYIKMNSRGKPLSEFENFKAELEGEIAKYDRNKATEISRKIDGVWTDLLWDYKDDSNTIDTPFLNFFRIICQIIAYKNNQTFSKLYNDSFDLLNKFFDADSSDFEKHLQIMETYFDNWYRISQKEPLEEFFGKHLSIGHDGDKVKLDQRYSEDLDIFKDAATTPNYTLPKVIFLYSFLVYLENQDTVSESEFRRRLRVVNNLIQNSQEEITDSENRVGGNRMPAILRQVDSIIISGVIDESTGISFNANQLEEESEKLEFSMKYPELNDSLFALEDHKLLNGQIAVIGLEQYKIFDRFADLFSCDYDKINRALLAVGNYSQEIGKGYDVRQFGAVNSNAAWRNLFHKSARNFGFEQTKEVLTKLLSAHKEFSDELLDTISREYIEKCEEKSLYDWRYYFIKYLAFRPDPKQERFYGKYYKIGYDMHVMVTEKRVSENAYSPFLREVLEDVRDGAKLEHDSMHEGYLDVLYVSKNETAYRFSNNAIEKMTVQETEDGYFEFKVSEKIEISQNEQGIDIENRIEKLKSLILH